MAHIEQERGSSGKKAKKPPKNGQSGSPVVGKRDEYIMDTNNSSIVSKRSVEKLYYSNQPEYFRYFVRKFHRRSPLINRGYWLRMKAIERTVSRFLDEDDGKTKLVVNLGCGYDPLPFQFLGIHSNQCENCVFVDVDYPQLMRRKVEAIKANKPLLDLLPGIDFAETGALLGSSDKYKAVGCNLNDVLSLDKALRQIFDLESSSTAILFVAEVSVAYMEKPAANAVLRWAAGLKDARFCLLEQHLPDGPDHPFAQTMLKHFQKLRTPLHAIGTIDEMRTRFLDAGWKSERVKIQTLWDLWSDSTFMSSEERQALDQVEPFDEWEEFALFGSHYFLLDARTLASIPLHETTTTTANESIPTTPWVSKSIESAHTQRRLAAAVIHNDSDSGEFSLAHGGGLGPQERGKTVDLYSTSGSSPVMGIADIPLPVMCHTLTNISIAGNKVLLVGGRASPDRPSAACWLFDGREWRQVEDIPTARYRHCAVTVSIASTETTLALSGVLVFGGKTTAGHLLNDFWFYEPSRGWQEVKVRGTELPEVRFGAAMATDSSTRSSGMLIGGMRSDGTVIDECWNWKLELDNNSLVLDLAKNPLTALSAGLRSKMFRFGAQLVSTSEGMVLIGGIVGSGILDRNTEFINLTSGAAMQFEHQVRPLVVGHSALVLDDGAVALLGGGATCFSFGTCWSQSCVLMNKDRSDLLGRFSVMKMIDQAHSQSPASAPPVRQAAPKQKSHKKKAKSVQKIPRRPLSSSTDFEDVIQLGEPVILEGLDLGACTSKWTMEYLNDQIGPDRKIVIHNSSETHMDFQVKNFTYQNVRFAEFTQMVGNGLPVYLRALSSEKPADVATDLEKDFPSIAADFTLPSELDHVRSHAHSSPLRISGPVVMWLHYDVMANVLCQIRGSKRLRLFKPEDVTELAVPPGASSSSINVWDASVEARLRAKGVQTLEAELNEGDVLFIPPLWLHTAQPTATLSIAVNVFFRDKGMEVAYAAGKDVYGNRDVAAYERGRRDVQRIVKSFDTLPPRVRSFYMSRLAQELHPKTR